ncbi:MAG: hypothetical protein K2P92_07345, partial [Bdellovibrionaceae bacterium]|nr:hypothetical protein [Pseudobdellovibrionaceae bacterium]
TAVIFKKPETVKTESKRYELQIFVSENKKPIQQKVSDKAICSDCGGASGGEMPFSVMGIKKRVLTVQYAGGGGWFRSHMDFKWRFKGGEFELIGLEAESGNAIPTKGDVTVMKSFNFLSGKVDVRKETVLTADANGDARDIKKTKKTCAIPKTLGLQKLSTFDFDQFVDLTVNISCE